MSNSQFNTDIIESWISMWNNYDLSMVNELFLDDHKVTYFSSEKKGVIKGIDDLIDHHREFGFVEGGKFQSNKLWLEDTHFNVFNGAVVFVAIWCFKKEGEEKIQRGPVTLVYSKHEGDYKIVHANFGNYL